MYGLGQDLTPSKGILNARYRVIQALGIFKPLIQQFESITLHEKDETNMIVKIRKISTFPSLFKSVILQSKIAVSIYDICDLKRGDLMGHLRQEKRFLKGQVLKYQQCSSKNPVWEYLQRLQVLLLILMTNNREYGNQDSEVKRLLQRFRQKDVMHHNQETFPQYSAVNSITNQNVLATSEISWLDKIAQINDKVCDQTIYQGREENSALRLANSMKFSFNQNYQTNVKQEQKNSYSKTSRGERSQSLSQIYMKKLEKESHKIKEVQKARKQIIDSINSKKHFSSSKQNKQNLVGSIKRKNSNFELASKANQFKQQKHQNKVSFGFEAVQLPKNIIIEKNKQANKEQEGTSLRYLQQSLAKTKKIVETPIETNQKVQLSKKSYLQSASNQQTYNETQSNTIPKQFTQRQGTISQFLQIIFQKVDKCKIGRLDKQNCDYQHLQDVCKIVLGSIFARIKFKNLTLSKQQFIKIGLQMIKELFSEELDVLIQTTVSEHNKKMKQSEEQKKSKGFYCQKCENKIEKVFSYSPQKNETYSQYKQTRQSLSPTKKQPMPSTASIPKQKPTNHTKSLIQFKSEQTRELQYNKYKLQRTKQMQSELQLNRQRQRLQIQRNMSRLNQFTNVYLSGKAEKNELKSVNLARAKKKRNISQSMIEEHKRNLQDLLILNEQVQNCLTKSSKSIVNQNQKALLYLQAQYNSVL